VSCLKNVDGVDRPGVGGSNSELDAAGSQRLEKLVPLRASELLGIVQPFEIGRKSVANPSDGQGHPGCDDWTRQPAAPRFIHASDGRLLSQTALDYLALLKGPLVKVRFDIVEVLLDEGVVREVRHLRNTFPLSRPYRYG